MLTPALQSGLSLLDPADPTLPEIAETAQSTLGDKVDGYVLGNVSDRVFERPRETRNHVADMPLDDRVGTGSLLLPWEKAEPRQLHSE